MLLVMHSDTHQPYTPERVLAIGAHADDIDFGASGSIAAWAKAGAHIEYVVITDGCKGTADKEIASEQLAATRQTEQREAAKILGAADVHFLGYEDGALEITQKLKKDLVEVIRKVKPDTVVVMDPTMVYSSQLGYINHTDHRAAGQATLDAIYPLARDHLSFPELLTAGLEPHKVTHVLLLNFEKQNCFIDISDTFDLKLAGLFAHKSQIPDTEKLRMTLRTRAEEAGQKSGFALAEGFVRIDVSV
jgi:LmbE family N-acetylglucosaminyl deacetylase